MNRRRLDRRARPGMLLAILLMLAAGGVACGQAGDAGESPPPAPAVEVQEPAPERPEPASEAPAPEPPSSEKPAEPEAEQPPEGEGPSDPDTAGPADEPAPPRSPQVRPEDETERTPDASPPAEAPEPTAEPAPSPVDEPTPAEPVQAPAPGDAGADATAPVEAGGDGADAEAQAEADRRAVRERRSQAITRSIQQLRERDIDELSEAQKAALVGQIAQGARVELGTLREETAQARLTLERVQEIAQQIRHDRRVVPRQVRTGQIPSLGASNRWDALQETNTELQEIIDGAFSERLRLLEEIPKAREALDEVRSLRQRSADEFDASQRDVLSDAEGYLAERLEAMRDLLDLFNQQAAIATAAYDESSRYTEELSEAMVAARQRGLLARSDTGISVGTFRALGTDLVALSGIGSAVASAYEEIGRPARTMLGYVLRLVATALLLAGAILLWLKLPGWLVAAFVREKGTQPRPDTDGGEDMRTLRQRRQAELITPVARAALLAAVAALGLSLWGLPQEWIVAALAVLGTWAAYFALMAVIRELLAPRHEQLRVLPIDTSAAAALFRLLRALALWSAVLLPIIWALSVLDYEHEDVLVLLSVVHVVGLAALAGWLIYGAGGPGEFIEGAEGRSAGSVRRVATAAVPAVLALVAIIAVLKAVGYVNLGEYLARILYLELPLIIVAFVLDWQVRRHFAAGSAWRVRLRAAVWAALAVAQIWVLALRWHHWLAIIDFLKRPLFTVAETEVSVFSILRAIVVVLIAWLVAKMLRRWLARSERIGNRVSEGVQYALSSLTFYIIIVAGVLWAMLVGGFPLNALTVLAGMAGIGLGFGLQDVVSNFVAGLILLLERPLAVGDYIEVAGTWGRVQSISLRSTVVRTQDNAHILVPNSDIISNQLTNLSHHDRTLRVVIPVGVGYDSDIDHVIDVLVEVAKEHPEVRDFPAPGARLAQFGDSAIVVELLVWISDPSGQVGAEVDLNLDIWRALKREGIEIPFPQRDLHIREDSAPLRIDTDWRDMPEDGEE